MSPNFGGWRQVVLIRINNLDGRVMARNAGIGDMPAGNPQTIETTRENSGTAPFMVQLLAKNRGQIRGHDFGDFNQTTPSVRHLGKWQQSSGL